MTTFSGSAAYLAWLWNGGTAVLNSDYRQFDWTPSLALIDSTAGADGFREYLAGTGEGGDISLSMVAQEGGTALIGALGRGNEGTLLYGPEGTATGKPKFLIPAISKGPAYSQPYDDVVDFKIGFQQNTFETASTWGTEYYLKVSALNPLAYWPLWDTSGTVATDIIGGYNARYVGCTLGQTGIGDGRTATLFNGSSDYAQISGTNLTALAATIGVAEFTIMCWLKAANAGVWTDGQQRRQIYFGFGSEVNDHFYLRKQTTNNTTRCGRAGTNTPHIAIDHTISSTAWFHACMTASIAADEVKFFIDGSQTGITYNSLQPILGSLASVLFGAASGVYFWSGYIAHIALFTSALTPAQVASAATV